VPLPPLHKARSRNSRKMGAVGVILLAVVVQSIGALPMFQAKMDSMVDSNSCVKQCMNRIVESKLELNIAKTVDYAFFFQHLDEICDLVDESKVCVAQCGITSNPFEMKHMTAMCTPEAMRTALAFLPCMKEKGAEVLQDCTKCGPIDQINTEIADLTEKLKKDSTDRVSLKAALLKTNQACGVTKCYARCSREGFTAKCKDVAGVEAGEFLKAFVETALQATRSDLEDMQLLQVMAANTPPQCDYMYLPDMMFNVTADAEKVKELEAHMPELPPEAQQRHQQQTMQEMMTLQHELLVRELAVLQKRERVLDKEELKLDLEIASIKKNSVDFV